MGLRELLSAYSLRFVDWLEKVVQPDPKDRYPDAEAAFNAFKPLYVKRVPEAIVSSSVLEFTASKLGERITQTLTVRNNIPETVLEGWWEVAPHPSDPPHTPNSHAWISFGSRKFSGNANECSIVVNTDKLMAGKVYERQILLHSNSLEDIKQFDLIVKTSEVPIQTDRLPATWSELLILFTLGMIPGFIGLFSNARAIGLISILLFCMCLVSFDSILRKTNNSSQNRIHTIQKLILRLLLIMSGFSLPGIFTIHSYYNKLHILFVLIFILTAAALALIIINPFIKHKKLVSKYRDSEEGLIKP